MKAIKAAPSSFAQAQLPLLNTLPVPLAAILMQQAQRAEWLFPAERRELELTLKSLEPPRAPWAEEAVKRFAAIRLSPELLRQDWRVDAAGFVERATAELWRTGQIGQFREAAQLLVPPTAGPSAPLKTPRTVVVVLASELRCPASVASPPLFASLRRFGTLFTSANDAAGAATLNGWLQARAAADTTPYAHWQVSGGAEAAPEAVAALSYAGLATTRHEILARFLSARENASTGGPEGLRQALLHLTPDQIGMGSIEDPVLRRFALDIFTEGSGTQLYATTFVQWSVREVLRRAQPVSLAARFTARSQATPMDLRVAHPERDPAPDCAGSLVDAEMGAYLSYLNLKRLPDADNASFLAWHEGYGQAVLIRRDMPAGVSSRAPATIQKILSLMSA